MDDISQKTEKVNSDGEPNNDIRVISVPDAKCARCKPVTHNGFLGTLPKALESLRGKRRWVLWRWEPEGDGWTKPPYAPSGRRASIDNPNTWSTFDEVLQAYRKNGVDFDGIGFVLSEEEAAFDLDDCKDEREEFHPWALNLINQGRTYSEVTVSGGGLRIIGLADGPPVHTKRTVPETVAPNANGMSAEIYRRAKRYITISGNQIDKSVISLKNIDALIDKTCAEL